MEQPNLAGDNDHSTYDLEEADLMQYLLAVGRSGVGKTILFYNLMDQLTVPFWAFEARSMMWYTLTWTLECGGFPMSGNSDTDASVKTSYIGTVIRRSL